MITVIIPVYNTESYIEQCVKSVLDQTLKDLEIIIVDDGSTDKTSEILDEISHCFQSIQVIHQSNKGLYKAREIGLSYAKGDYVGWVDADDFIEPEMFEVLYKTAIENDSELVICDYSWYPKKKKTKGKWFREYSGTVDVEFVEHNSQVWNKIVKRELLERLNVGPLFNSCFDEIYIRVLMEAKNPVTINRSLYHYRIGYDTLSSSYTNVDHYRDFVEASKKLRDLMKLIVTDQYWQDYFDYRVAYYLIITMIIAANLGNREEYEKKRKELLLIKPSFKKNQHFRKIMRRNFGLVRARVIGDIIPIHFTIARLACNIGFR